MQLFVIIATAHFLALLSPGPDFFLVARNAANSGWKIASGACLGIALANGLFIAVAFAGLSLLREGSAWFVALQLAGGVYLVYVGWLFIRHANGSDLGALATAQAARRGWLRGVLAGFLCAVLNPKNALFYASLASLVSASSTGWKWLYALWMFSVVLLWDLLVAIAIGHPRVLRRFGAVLPWLQRVSGGLLLVLGLLVLVHVLMAWE
ncbi:LysE family translocator [Pseudomonas cremoricolorata]|uniref:LysE family translocator n=1 Tax=Pseudomonas cremoricolorata TaxID=157783 RepID=UPI000416CA9D|nr:LysE family transporter [Pseudomonas cremoricolorata]